MKKRGWKEKKFRSIGKKNSEEGDKAEQKHAQRNGNTMDGLRIDWVCNWKRMIADYPRKQMFRLSLPRVIDDDDDNNSGKGKKWINVVATAITRWKRSYLEEKEGDDDLWKQRKRGLGMSGSYCPTRVKSARMMMMMMMMVVVVVVVMVVMAVEVEVEEEGGKRLMENEKDHRYPTSKNNQANTDFCIDLRSHYSYHVHSPCHHFHGHSYFHSYFHLWATHDSYHHIPLRFFRSVSTDVHLVREEQREIKALAL